MNRKGLIILGFWIGGLWFLPLAALATCDCLGESEVSTPSLRQVELELIDARLRRGEFEQSYELLIRSVDMDPRLSRIQQVLDHYLALSRGWAEQDQEAHQERLTQWSRYKAAWEAKEPTEAEKVFLLLAQIQQDSEEEAAALAKEPWISELLDQMEAQCRQLEARGEYRKAYDQGLRWLLLASPDDSDLQEQAKRLLEKAEIRQALTPPDCSGQINVYDQAGQEVFFTGLRVLEQQYIRNPDYFMMADGMLRRMERLGLVLQAPPKGSAYTVDPNQAAAWQEGIDAYYDRIFEQEKWSRRNCESLVEDVLMLNEMTLNLPPGFLVFQMSRAALAALDPYTEIVWPAQSGDFDKRMTGQFAGVGLRLAMEKGRLKITDVMPDTPAAESGQLRPDDWIAAIDDESTVDMSIACAVQKISGPEGTAVMLTVQRDEAAEDFKVELTRRRIVIPTLQGSSGSQYRQTPDSMMFYRIDPDPGIGYIRVDRFGPQTAERLRSLLENLEQNGLRGLILDLRSNAGGLLDVSAKVTDLFLKEGTIVKTEPRHGSAMQFEADSHTVLEGGPVVILINEGTASGAEITAGALTGPGHPRAVLVGTRTYGKGSVQEIEPLAADGSRMKYTRSLYVLSDDRKVPNRYEVEKDGREDWGIAPDVPIRIGAGRAKAMKKIQDQLRQADPNDPASLAVLQSLADNDPQLAAGLAILKVQMISRGYELKTEPESVLASTPVVPETVSAGEPNSLQAAQ